MELAVKRSIGDEGNVDIENVVRVAFTGKAMGGLRMLDWIWARTYLLVRKHWELEMRWD